MVRGHIAREMEDEWLDESREDLEDVEIVCDVDVDHPRLQQACLVLFVYLASMIEMIWIE
jgi:hypothetical protein